MQKSETVGELAKALAVAQGEIEGAKKDSENPFFKSKYADLASIRDACQAALSKQGIAIVQVPGTVITENATVISVETLLMHSSGEWISGDLSAIPVKDDPQGIGSCITYLRRYAMASFAGVAPEDDDGNAASQGNGSRPTRQTQRPQSQKSVEITKIKQALVDTCKLLNKAGDSPVWGAKRLDEFANQEYGANADSLELEPLRELLQKLSNKLDMLKKGQQPPSQDVDIEAEARKSEISKLQQKYDDKILGAWLKRDHEGKGIEQLTLDQLLNAEDELVPF
jgi:hypothetical protein